MNCIGKPLSEEELIAALDGEADSDIQNHLQQCPFCQTRLHDIERFEELLYREAHPNSQALLDYSFGLLNETNTQSIQDHISICDHCQTTLAEFKTYQQEETSTIKHSIPATRLPSRQLNPGDLLKELVAVFKPQNKPAFAFLGDAPSSFVAEASGIRLFLHTGRVEEKNYSLSGQVVAEDQIVWEGAIATLARQDKPEPVLSSTLLDDLGQFAYKPISPGVYKLRVVALSDVAITLYNLELL